MVKLFTVKEMLAVEKEANEKGLTYELMMENAGQGIAEEIINAYSHLHQKKILAIVGSGNNGGDALVALYHLAKDQWETYAYIVRPRSADDPLIRKLVENGGKVIQLDEDKKHLKLVHLLTTCSILLDGVFGTGIKLPLKEEAAKLLLLIKTNIEKSDKHIHVIAVDCPSGVDCESGEAADETIPAEMTVTMAGMKTGLITFPAAKLTGEIRFASIGPIDEVDAYKNNQKIVLTEDTIRDYLPERPLDAHKGTFGTALIVAGSVNYTGAALLAGKAAYRAGVGLVSMAVPAVLHEALAGEFPESTWVLLPHELGVISADAARIVHQNVERATAILIGPGFGLEDTTREFLSRLFSHTRTAVKREIGFIHENKPGQVDDFLKKPFIMDADGLKLMSQIPNWYELLPAPAIITPHPGEMSVISGLPIADIQADRLGVARKYAEKWGHVIVLKGAFTVIAAPDGQMAIVPVATSALAKAGTGDVLAGLITGFRAQGVEAFQAACAGAWIHAQAGLRAAAWLDTPVSVLASDVLNAVPEVIGELQSTD